MEDKIIESMIDAFIALNDVSDDAVEGMIKKPMTEGKSFKVNNFSDMSEAKDFFDTEVNVPNDEIDVIDTDADALDHLKDNKSYIGQAILCCERCKANTFIDFDKLKQDTDDPNIYNKEMECPHCHQNETGFSLIGQVGKAVDISDNSSGEDETSTEENDEFELEFPNADSVETDKENSNETLPTFDNIEEEEEETEKISDEPDEEESEENNIELYSKEKEPDPMETITSEDEVDEVEKEVKTKDGKTLKLKIKRQLGDIVEEEFEEDTDADELLGEDITSDYVDHGYGDKAWKLNQVIQHMNNEDAYFGGWLYIWPDGETYDECLADFGDKEDYEDLKSTFDRVYRRYHSDGLYDAPENVVTFAHEMDKELGLKPIENLERVKPVFEKVNDREKFKKVSNFLEFVNKPENINKIVVKTSGKNSLFEGVSDDIDYDIGDKEVKAFNVDNGFLTCNIDSDAKDGGKLGSVLKRFDNDDSDKIILCDGGDECFKGTKEDAIDQFGDCKFCGIEAPRILVLIVDGDEVAAEEAPIDKYIDRVYQVNGMNSFAEDLKGSDEHWISEVLRNRDKEELDTVFEKFIEPTNDTILIEGFKKICENEDLTDSDFDEIEVSDQWTELPTYEDVCKFGRGTKWGVCDPKQGKHFYDVYANHGQFYGRIVDGVRQLKFVDAERDFVQAYDDQMNAVDIDENIDEAFHTLDRSEIRYAVDDAWDQASNDLGKNATVDDFQRYYEDNILVDVDFDPNLLKRIITNRFIKNRVGVREELEEKVLSFKTRKELSEAIQKCKNNNEAYSIRRSLSEGYRYDLIKEEYNPDNYKSDDLDAKADEYEEEQKVLADLAKEEAEKESKVSEDLDDEEALVPINNDTNALDTLSDVERDTILKIGRISSDICEAIYDTYGIEADPRLVAADILQDLRLISHDIDPDDLPDTASNRATKEMFRSFEDTMDLIDGLMSMFTGSTIESTPDRRLAQAIRMLDSPSFSTEAIWKGIQSDRFLAAAEQGAVPYITGDQLLGLTEEVDFPTEQFDEELNEYFKSNYSKDVSYTTKKGSFDKDGNILLEGILSDENATEPRFDLDVKFILEPVSEEVNESMSTRKKIQESTYKVTNNLSEEIFEFKI